MNSIALILSLLETLSYNSRASAVALFSFIAPNTHEQLDSQPSVST